MTPDELQDVCRSCKTPLALAEAFSQVPEADRKKLSKPVQALFKAARQGERDNWGMPTHQGAVARLAILACCPWSQAKRVANSGRGMFPDRGPWMEAACQILTDRRPAWAGDWISLQLDSTVVWGQDLLKWEHVRQLMQAGVIERPATDGYIRLLARSGPGSFDPQRDVDTLEHDVWRLFEVENFAFEFFPEPKKIDRERWRTGELATQPGPLHAVYHGWPRKLYQLAHDGQIDRARLIDAILAGLWHDFRSAMRTGLLRFLEVLDVTDGELAQREPALLELLRNGQGPVVGMALTALARLQKAKQLDADAFLAAVPAVFHIATKSQPKAALSLIDKVVTKAPAHLAGAVEAVRGACQHESPDVQERAVDLLAKWKAKNGSLDLTRVAVEAEGLAAHHRRRLDELAEPSIASASENSSGAPAAPATPSAAPDSQRAALLHRAAALPEWLRAASGIVELDELFARNMLPPPFDPDPACFPVLSGLERVEPIANVDELIDAVAHLFEVTEGPEQIERVVDGLLRLGHETTDEFDAKTEPLRHPKFDSEWFGGTAAAMLMWSVPSVVQLIGDWLHVRFNAPWHSQGSEIPALEIVSRRIEAFRPHWQSGPPAPSLAMPTHCGGWIDPRVFVRRLSMIFAAERLPNHFDLIAGLLRLAPDFRSEARELAATLPTSYRRIVEYALGAEVQPTTEDSERADLWLAAGRARQPRGDLDELRVLGLSDKEPDGIAQAVFQLDPDVDPVALKRDRWSAMSRSRTISMTPREPNFKALHSRPTVALAVRLMERRTFSFLQNWQQELMTSLWPANSDSTLAVACHQLLVRLDDKGSMFEPVEGTLKPLTLLDRGWSEIGRTALWLSLLSRDDQARGVGIDVMIDGINDGRAHPEPLGQTLVCIAAGGWLKLNRLAESLREVTRTSLLAERVVAELLDRLIASWPSPPRDAHHVLGLQSELLGSLQQAPSEPARESLQRLEGSSKAAKLARRLCELGHRLPSPEIEQATLEAARGRIARCERIASYLARERINVIGPGEPTTS